MDRLFKRSNTKKFTTLNKMWDFITDPENIGVSEKWYENFPDGSIKMSVPSCWNNTLGYFRYVGVTWYRTEFFIESDSVSIIFDGVNHECDVYVDGKHLGYHYGGFVEFSFDAEGIGAGRHELIVRVDNTTNTTDTIPHTNTDWFNYGGICRPVGILELEKSNIRSLVCKYDLSEDLKNVTLRVISSITSNEPVTDELEVLVDGESVFKKTITVNGKLDFESDGILLENIKLWDINKPNLYYVTVKFAGDDLIDRIGFRKIEARGKDLFLNNRKIKIIGVCRHEIHPDWGYAMPFELVKKDIDIIRDMNCNAVRAAHYPHGQKTIDYCDELGLLFWEEIPLWGNLASWADSLKEESFIERILLMFKEMMARDMNHPSLIFWGLYNEIDTALPQTRSLTERMVKMVRAEDSSRLISYATCSIHHNVPQDICSDLVDMVGFNYYIGWFPTVKQESFEDFVMRMRAQVDKNAGGREMPMMMSEFGGAALKGACSFEQQRWTENYQSLLLTKGIETYFGSDEMCGGYIWQFCNTQAQPCFETQRPGGVNNKGVVDEFRRPKHSYETVKQLYRKFNPDSDNVTEIELF